MPSPLQTDTLKLWQIICSNKLLSTVEFILFLNKLDILDTKLKEGIQFSEYVTSYKGKPNETKPVAKCESLAHQSFQLYVPITVQTY